MSNGSSGRVAMMLTAIAAMIGVPVLLGALYNSWRVLAEARNQAVLRAPAPDAAELPPPPELEAPPIEEYVPPPAAERPIPMVVLDLLEARLETAHVDDFDPSLPYRLAVDGAEGVAMSATVDLGRDGTIDEYWTLRPEVSREVVENGARHRMVRRDGEWVRE
jgi:hypothetical protein